MDHFSITNNRINGPLLNYHKHLGILIKYLDSAIRLPVQTHPDVEFSQKFFHSNYGKTEMWMILATRKHACIYFGFSEKINADEFQVAVDLSLTNKNIFEPLLNKVEVKKGEIFLIPAKAVHAIGYGCMILEVQEPTDFTIQPEHWCGNHKMNDYERYLGLSDEDAMKCFDFSIYGKECVTLTKKEPQVVFKTTGIQKESLISYNDTPCFCVHRYILYANSIKLEAAPAIYIVTVGSGIIIGRNESIDLKMGDCFLLPYDAGGNYQIVTHTNIEVIECMGHGVK